MAKRKRWPNNAAWARRDAIDDLGDIIHALTPLVYGDQMTRTETLRRQSIALTKAQHALLGLESVK